LHVSCLCGQIFFKGVENGKSVSIFVFFINKKWRREKVKEIFIFLWMFLAFGVQAQQIPKEDMTMVTFFPVYERAKELVAVELVGPTEEESRFQDLEREVMRNDWRPRLPGSTGYNPGKCTVVVYATIFDVGCWLVSYDQQRERWAETKVATVTEVITFVKHFSTFRRKM